MGTGQGFVHKKNSNKDNEIRDNAYGEEIVS